MKDTEEHVKKIGFRLKVSIGYTIAVIILIFILAILANEGIGENSIWSKEICVFGLIIFFSATIPVVLWWNYTKELEEIFYSDYEEYYLSKISQKNKENQPAENESQELILEKETHDEDAIYNMLKNNREIRAYFRITKQQEIASYIISIICAVLGVVILIYSVYAVFKNINIEVAAISVISGTITEIVSGIVLWIHNKSAMQLNYYYDALHENEKFLSAINLADKLEKKEKEQMYMEIIKAQIKVTGEKEESENNA